MTSLAVFAGMMVVYWVSASQEALRLQLRLLEWKVAFLCQRVNADQAALEAEFVQAEAAKEVQLAAKERREMRGRLLAGGIGALLGTIAGAVAWDLVGLPSLMLGTAVGAAVGYVAGCMFAGFRK